jgi:hypothetical protein
MQWRHKESKKKTEYKTLRTEARIKMEGKKEELVEFG